MRLDTNRRIRRYTMRPEAHKAPQTRETRLRYLPTKNCHAALRRYHGVTREYQSDASSRSPALSVSSSLRLHIDLPPPNRRKLPRFDRGSLHISVVRHPSGGIDLRSSSFLARRFDEARPGVLRGGATQPGAKRGQRYVGGRVTHYTSPSVVRSPTRAATSL